MLLLCFASSAADLTGKWIGTVKGIEAEEKSAFLNLKQDGNELTGTAGPNEGQQWPILNGKIDGDKITFQINADGPLVKFDLSLVDSHIKGVATFEMEGERKQVTLDLTRKAQ